MLVGVDALIRVSLGSCRSSLVDSAHIVAPEAVAASVTAHRTCSSGAVGTVVIAEDEAVGGAVANTCRGALGVYVESVRGALVASAEALEVGLDALARVMRQRHCALSVATLQVVEVQVAVLVVRARCTVTAVVSIALVVPLQRHPVVLLGSRTVSTCPSTLPIAPDMDGRPCRRCSHADPASIPCHATASRIQWAVLEGRHEAPISLPGSRTLRHGR